MLCRRRTSSNRQHFDTGLPRRIWNLAPVRLACCFQISFNTHYCQDFATLVDDTVDSGALTKRIQFLAVASPAMGHWGTCPPWLSTISFLVQFGVNLTAKYCVVCEISWCRCQQLITALSISTALIIKLLVIEQLLHPALKSTVSAPWHNFHLCPSSQQNLATPLIPGSGNVVQRLGANCSHTGKLQSFAGVTKGMNEWMNICLPNTRTSNVQNTRAYL